MRSAGEPGSREEDTIPVQCRDTCSEGGGYGTRLSDVSVMNSTGLVGNTATGMSAMRRMQMAPNALWPRSRGERSHKVAGTSPHKEGTQGAQGREESARCADGDIGG